MQNWCPESFGPEAETAVVAGDEAAAGFTGEAASLRPAQAGQEELRFRREAGFTDSDTILQHMSRQERAVVFELVEIDVAARFEERERELREELSAAHTAETTALRDATRRWAREYADRRDEDLRELAAAGARLAVQLAERIVRNRVAEEPEVLVRAIEAALRAAGGARDLTLTVAPEDAVWLEADAELRERLGIERIVADRRVDRGGCLIAAEDREWDATLAGQLDTLGEVVDEWLATATDPPANEEDDGEPAVE